MRLLALLVGLALAACVQVSERSPVGVVRGEPALCRPAAAWEVVCEGAVVGVVIEFREQGDASRRFFSVRNAHQQELGLVDGHGRAWRFSPHTAETECVGSGPLLEGAARILTLEGACRLFDVDLEALQTETAGSATPPPGGSRGGV
ncbi:MAG: hypothetical protein QF903_06855 [Planctomycetota bacterium]|nr:hypothetical protein [Planctomycetota bacterium]MDP6989182.1 hypothetical protein [Planctomycetota bacterium]